jgi:hypothetical protein
MAITRGLSQGAFSFIGRFPSPNARVCQIGGLQWWSRAKTAFSPIRRPPETPSVLSLSVDGGCCRSFSRSKRPPNHIPRPSLEPQSHRWACLCRGQSSKPFWLRCPSDNSSSDMVLPAPSPPARTEYAASSGSASSQPPVVVIGTLDHSPTKPSCTQTPSFQASTPPRGTRDSSFQQADTVSISRPKRSLNDGEDTPSFKKRHRVNHACEPCRERKSKYSAERPICKHCHDSKIACFYTDGKRNRVKK